MYFCLFNINESAITKIKAKCPRIIILSSVNVETTKIIVTKNGINIFLYCDFYRLTKSNETP